MVRSGAAIVLGLVALMGAGATHAADIACQSHPVPSASCFRPTEADAAPCQRTPPVMAACFEVSGRLSAWNGAPSLRLQPAGSRRLLGVFGADGDPASPRLLPDAVRAAMTPTEPGSLRPVSGAFSVCPLATARPGRMQPVCIAGARRLRPGD